MLLRILVPVLTHNHGYFPLLHVINFYSKRKDQFKNEEHPQMKLEVVFLDLEE